MKTTGVQSHERKRIDEIAKSLGKPFTASEIHSLLKLASKSTVYAIARYMCSCPKKYRKLNLVKQQKWMGTSQMVYQYEWIGE